MNKQHITLTLVTVGCLISGVKAQDMVSKPEKPLRASIGIYNPVGAAMRSRAGSPLPMISLGYDAGKTVSDHPFLYGVYLDYAANKKNGTNNSVTAFGVSGRYIANTPTNAEGHSFVGAGIGSYSVKLGATNSKVGGKLFGGYERNDGYFGEAAYHIITKVNGADPSGISLTIGRRF